MATALVAGAMLTGLFGKRCMAAKVAVDRGRTRAEVAGFLCRCDAGFIAVRPALTNVPAAHSKRLGRW